METIDEKKYTVEEYFSLVEEAEYKLEYYRGQVYAMAGAKPNHNLINVQLTKTLSLLLEDKDCYVFNSDQALAIQDNSYFYPDAMVTCGPIELDNNRTRVLNPILIVEILSKGTRGFDKDRKFDLYREIPSLQEYLLLDSESIGFQSFFKEKGDLWRISSGYAIDQAIPLYSLDLEISLERIYRKILPFEGHH